MGDVTHYAGDQCPGGHYEETDVSEAAKNSYLHFDGMSWPNPDDPALIEWRLRYGSPDEVAWSLPRSWLRTSSSSRTP